MKYQNMIGDRKGDKKIMARIGTVKPHNKRMQDFLRENGFPYAVVKYINKGSLRGSWRVYSRPKVKDKERVIEAYDKWSQEIADKLNALGFSNLWGKPLGRFDGNGGLFSVFIRGHNEFLKDTIEEDADREMGIDEYTSFTGKTIGNK